MENKTRNKWQIRLAVMAILIIGFIAGALAMNAYRAWRRESPPMMGRRFDQIFERLGLTPQQQEEVREIMDDARSQLLDIRKQSEPKFRQVRKQTDERLQSVLTEDQWEKFQRMKPEFRGRRPHGRDRHGDQR